MCTDYYFDIMFSWFDERFSKGEFALADDYLRLARFDRLGEDQIVGLLTCTLPAKDLLPSRKEFIRLAYIRLAELPESQDNLAEIFKGLE